MSLSPTSTVADVVTNHPECASVFQSFRIDFCCKGELSVEDACRERGLDADEVLAELERTLGSRAARYATDLRGHTTEELVALVVDRHHGYLRQALPFVVALSEKVADVHGDKDARLVTIDETVQALSAKLIAHLDEEEREVFPLLLGPGRRAPAILFSTIQEEHVWVGEQLERLRELTDDYHAPSWACRSCRALYAELEAIHTDTLRHVHIENHVIFPRFQR